MGYSGRNGRIWILVFKKLMRALLSVNQILNLNVKIFVFKPNRMFILSSLFKIYYNDDIAVFNHQLFPFEQILNLGLRLDLGTSYTRLKWQETTWRFRLLLHTLEPVSFQFITKIHSHDYNRIIWTSHFSRILSLHIKNPFQNP